MTEKKICIFFEIFKLKQFEKKLKQKVRMDLVFDFLLVLSIVCNLEIYLIMNLAIN